MKSCDYRICLMSKSGGGGQMGGRQEVKDGLTRVKLAENLCSDSFRDTQAGRSKWYKK